MEALFVFGSTDYWIVFVRCGSGKKNRWLKRTRTAYNTFVCDSSVHPHGRTNRHVHAV
jgi:carboxylesterase type B